MTPTEQKLREALRALEVLFSPIAKDSTAKVWIEKAREALALPPTQADEPFGYFRPEPFGWTDCAETDEGAIALYTHPAVVPEDVRTAVVDALRDALSVCMSVSICRDRKIVRDGATLYAQTEEWCQWLESEVGPKVRDTLDAITAAPELEGGK